MNDPHLNFLERLSYIPDDAASMIEFDDWLKDGMATSKVISYVWKTLLVLPDTELKAFWIKFPDFPDFPDPITSPYMHVKSLNNVLVWVKLRDQANERSRD